MLKEIRKMESVGKANYIRLLQNRGKIGKHISPKGYLCYDTEELKAFQKSNRRGRPAKLTKKEN